MNKFNVGDTVRINTQYSCYNNENGKIRQIDNDMYIRYIVEFKNGSFNSYGADEIIKVEE